MDFWGQNQTAGIALIGLGIFLSLNEEIRTGVYGITRKTHPITYWGCIITLIGSGLLFLFNIFVVTVSKA